MLACFSASLTDSGGRSRAVKPSRQIVEPMLLWVTAGSIAPGVQRGSGSENTPEARAWQEYGRGRTTVAGPLPVATRSVAPPPQGAPEGAVPVGAQASATVASAPAA